jgi:hypothetical protein
LPQQGEEFAVEIGAAPFAIDSREIEFVEGGPDLRGEVGAAERLEGEAGAGVAAFALDGLAFSR